MNQFSKALIYLLFISLSIIFLNCNEEKKKNNLAAVAFLAASSQTQNNEYIVTINGQLNFSATTVAADKVYQIIANTQDSTTNSIQEESVITRSLKSKVSVQSDSTGKFGLTLTLSALNTTVITKLAKVSNPGETSQSIASEGNDGAITFVIKIDTANPSSLTQVSKQESFKNGLVGVTATISDVKSVSSSSLVGGGNTIGEKVCDSNKKPEQTLSGDISGNITITSSAILTGTVFVKDGATLTVNAGSVVYGNRGSSIFVLPGGKLNSNGTKDSPVCFTSAGNIGARQPGDWGGIVMIGKGTTTRTSSTEGTTPQNYGCVSNCNDADSSGSLRYTIIEFAGNEVAPGDELNGLSLYAVGSGTTIEYVQVHRGLDDGFEWWGGKANGKYLLVTGGLDDDFDMDEGFSGTLQYLIGHKYPTSCGGTASTDPHGMEMDGSHNNGVSSAIYSNPTVSNYTLIGANVTSSIGQRFREGLSGNFSKGLVYNFTQNFKCDNNTAGGQNTNPTISNVSGQANISSSIGSQCTASVIKTEITLLPIKSSGSIDTDCGAKTAPDYTTVDPYNSYEGGSPTSIGKWWDGWTVYRSK